MKNLSITALTLMTFTSWANCSFTNYELIPSSETIQSCKAHNFIGQVKIEICPEETIFHSSSGQQYVMQAKDQSLEYKLVTGPDRDNENRLNVVLKIEGTTLGHYTINVNRDSEVIWVRSCQATLKELPIP